MSNPTDENTSSVSSRDLCSACVSEELEINIDTLHIWHGQLMTISTAMQMLIATMSHSSQSAQFQAIIELAYDRLVGVLDEMDTTSMMLAQKPPKS